MQLNLWLRIISFSKVGVKKFLHMLVICIIDFVYTVESSVNLCKRPTNSSITRHALCQIQTLMYIFPLPTQSSITSPLHVS
ncbi:hypothetical protein XELAEV_18028750mg [Xenopus laevis]|uniref:Uncharacterized protein n=1 Tax=Xenopus laevis TaxID=8355 RepID=A0A974HH54_XENLA|nr:hypothetical protein XELAEV_18028750mg [Xenopus laevis]